jgi:putative transposase
MSRQKKPPNNLASRSEPLSDGRKKAISKRSKRRQDNEDTTCSPIQVELNLFGQQLSTPELVPARSSQSLIDKLLPSLPSTPMQKSSAKLEEDSITDEKSFKPYWNESCKELSDALLWRTSIGLPDSDLTTFNGSVTTTGVKSWYSTKQTSVREYVRSSTLSESLRERVLSPATLVPDTRQNGSWLRTYLPYFTASVLGSTGLESTRFKCRKIQIYPSPELNRVWKQWNAACRYVYNQAIAYQKINGWIGKFKLRDIIMQSDLPTWVKDSPCHI